MSAVEFVEEELARPKALAVVPPSLETIVMRVAVVFGVPAVEILTSSATPGARQRPYANARHVAMWLAYRKLPGASYPAVGTLFGGRDHTTVMAGVRKVTRAVGGRTPLGQIASALDAEIRGVTE